MSISDFEICSECGYQISRFEQAFVFKGDIVCLECDNKLRGTKKTTDGIPNKELKIKDIIIEKGEDEMNVDTVINDGDKSKIKMLIEEKLETSDTLPDLDEDETLFKENISDDSDGLFIANSQGNDQQIKIQLPSFIHSCFIDRNFSTNSTQLKKKYRSVGGFVLLFSVVGLVAVGAVLVTKYLL